MAKKITKPKEVALTISLEAKPDTPSYYANYMAVSHTPYDFTIGATRIAPGLLANLSPDERVQAKKSGKVSLEPILQVIIPPEVAEGLITALTVQVKEFEDQAKARKKT